MNKTNIVKTKRIYEDPSNRDGYRVLVDRLWPRGVSKEAAKLDEWLKELGPSDELRKWFNHDPDKFSEFKQRYKQQLKSKKREQALQKLTNLKKEKTLTLLFAAKEEKYNHTQILKEVLEKDV